MIDSICKIWLTKWNILGLYFIGRQDNMSNKLWNIGCYNPWKYICKNKTKQRIKEVQSYISQVW